MDMESGKQQLITAIKKYQYVLLVVLVGVFLMLLPQNREEPLPEVPEKGCDALASESKARL